jgi:hypothetical protein
MLRYFSICIIILSVFSACIDEATKHKENLEAIAENINKKCPKMLDSETRFEGIEFIEPNTLVYKYTLVNLLKQNVDTAEFYRALWPGLISNIKISPDMKRLRENSTLIEYYYLDKNHQPIYTFHIGPQHYN